MRFSTLVRIGTVVFVVGGMAWWAAAQERLPGLRARAAHSQPASRPHEHFGRLPLPLDQTFERQNSPQDKLRIDLTHSAVEAGKHVAYVRLVWGDLDNVIKGGGPQYYSDWDGHVTLDSGAGQAVHKIAFEDGGKVTTRPALVGAVAHPRAAVRNPAKAAAAVERHAAASRPGHRGPGPGSGRDELVTASGAKIEWKAGVVGAFDGLLIKVSADTPSASGTITAGNFTLPFKLTPAP